MRLKELMAELKESSGLTAMLPGLDGKLEQSVMSCEVTIDADGKVENVKVTFAVGGRG